MRFRIREPKHLNGFRAIDFKFRSVVNPKDAIDINQVMTVNWIDGISFFSDMTRPRLTRVSPYSCKFATPFQLNFVI